MRFWQRGRTVGGRARGCILGELVGSPAAGQPASNVAVAAAARAGENAGCAGQRPWRGGSCQVQRLPAAATGSEIPVLMLRKRAQRPACKVQQVQYYNDQAAWRGAARQPPPPGAGPTSARRRPPAAAAAGVRIKGPFQAKACTEQGTQSCGQQAHQGPHPPTHKPPNPARQAGRWQGGAGKCGGGGRPSG
jgi:hypothetical protein